MKESLEERKTRTKTILLKLKRYYPDAHCALNHSNSLQLLMATILSAQCTDERVNLVTKTLFKKYRTAKDFAEAAPSEMEEIIRPAGFFRAKTKSLIGSGKKLVSDFGGQVPADMEKLRTLPGVGRKTANVVLGVAFHIPSGIVVDTHVKRLSYRLGLTLAKTPDDVEVDLQKVISQKDWIQFSHELIFHGRKICKARKPQCEICPLEGECPKRGVTIR